MSTPSSQQQSEATFFPETIVEGRVDADFVIYGLANSFSVPQWIPTNKLKTCHHCKDALKSSRTHNCRLCGDGFCSKCTTKCHLPEKYEQKSKQGPSRVCYSCKLSCIRMRQAALNLALDSIQRMLRPPVWQDLKTYVACNKCCVKRRSPHNCRLCGDLYCDDCTTKMNINLPPAFNLKNKMGPQRVCDGCRYRIIAGARLDDGTQEQIQLFLRQQSLGQLSNGSGCTSPGTPNIEPLVLTNNTGPTGGNTQQQTLAQQKLQAQGGHGRSSIDNGTPNQGIRIVYSNTANVVGNGTTFVPTNYTTIPLDTITPRQHGLSISQHSGSNPHPSHDVNQITASLNSLSLDSDTSTGLSPRVGVNNLRYQLTPTSSGRNNGLNNTMAARSQRYAAVPGSSPLSSGRARDSSGSNQSGLSTPSINAINQLVSTPLPNDNVLSPEQQPTRPLLDPMGEELQFSLAGHGQPRKKPVGGRDIFRALSTVHPPPPAAATTTTTKGVKTTTIKTPLTCIKIHEQTLDDQKEDDMDDESIPPPPPQPVGVIEHSNLVKPSDLFARLRAEKK